MTMQEFVDACVGGAFVNDDGSGYYATECRITEIPIRPSDVRAGCYHKDFSHVMWFNK